MSAAAPVLYRIYDLPWTTGEVERERLRKIMRTTFGALLVLSLVLSFLPVPEQSADEPQEIPRRLARLVVERQAPPPPPPPVVREEPVEVPPVVEPERVVEEKRVEPEPVVENEPPPPVDTTAQARERARSAGVLQFASQLSALRTNADVTADRLERTGTVGAGTEAAAVNERSVITSRVGTASGGINTASLSRNTGGGGLGGRTTTVVESPVEGFGEAGGAAQRSGASDKGSRSREEIERVFDANKGRIFTLYNRALRANPALQGKVVLRLTIAADGRVTFCEIVSSELNDPELERGLVQRVLQFQFEARDDVEAITTTKPIDFFPG
ncbi:MAG: energy transducer TonB [Lysobacterales bacterium]|nr:MAG: energy transducer TonB [Xanthomonadales bacterium]